MNFNKNKEISVWTWITFQTYHELVLCNRLLCSNCCVTVTEVAKLTERKQTSLQADLNIKQCFTNLQATFSSNVSNM